MASAPLLLQRRNNWKNLPGELLDLILQKLVLLPDCIRFSVVCKDWLSIALEHKQKHNRVNPMLFVPNTDTNYRNLFNIWENKVYNFQFPIPYRKKCNGCSHGWWAIAEMDMSITLINPFTGKWIHLPSIMDICEIYYQYYANLGGFKPEYLIFKVILSSDLSLIAAIYDQDNKLALIRSGEQSWTYIDESLRPFRDCYFEKGRLYAVNGMNDVFAIDYNGHARISMEYVMINSLIGGSWTSYIVESLDGFLLLIQRIYLNIDQDVTVCFKVYKLNITNLNEQNRREWEEIDDVGNCALFLGNNQSICITASNLSTCQPNSIYYTDDTRQWGDEDPDFVPKDIGIFNLKTKEISRYYEISNFLRNIPAAVWILPPWF